MIRGISGRVVLLVLAILFMVALILTSRQKPPVDDPVGDAQQELLELMGLGIERGGSMNGTGLKVTKVVRGKPAQQRGLREGDLILAVNERSVWHAKQLLEFLQERLGKTVVALMIKRDGKFQLILFGSNRMQGASPTGSPGIPGTIPSGPDRSGPTSRRGGS